MCFGACIVGVRMIGIQMYAKAAKANWEQSDAVVGWLKGFVTHVGLESAHSLLMNVGHLEQPIP